MPLLINPRHEAFAHARARGDLLEDAYELAGFAPGQGHASRLAKRPMVALRIAELRALAGAGEVINGEAVLGALMKLAASFDAFDTPERLRETRATLLEARKMQQELAGERAAERLTIQEARRGRPRTAKSRQDTPDQEVVTGL